METHRWVCLLKPCVIKFCKISNVVVTASGEESDASPFAEPADHSVAYIKHFTTKTIEEWMENKVKRGQCDSVANTEGLQHNALMLFFSRNKKTKAKTDWLRKHGYATE